MVIKSTVPSLSSLIVKITIGPWRFIQLRGDPLGPHNINIGDIDLLGGRESVDALLGAAFEWVCEGLCHLRIRARSEDKVALVLLSLDGQQSLMLDLWVNLWQLENGRRCLRYDDCVSLLIQTGSSILRLPSALEACVYVNHLKTKRKKIADERVQRRLAGYVQKCGDSPRLVEIINAIAVKNNVDANDLLVCNEYLQSQGLVWNGLDRSWWLNKLYTELVAAWLDGPRRTRAISLMGCDGSGKTSLAHSLCEKFPSVFLAYTGKHLYRKSIFYKLAVIFIRPFVAKEREHFDEKIAPWNYVRACVALQIRLWLRNSRIKLIDRSLVDFMMVERKTDKPHFHSAAWLLDILGRRIPVIHIIVTPEGLQRRKQEMTPFGQVKYDCLMFQYFSRRAPTEYCAFFNGEGLDVSTIRLLSLLKQITDDWT